MYTLSAARKTLKENQRRKTQKTRERSVWRDIEQALKIKAMNKKIGVLIFPAGETNSIELHDSLSYCVNIRLYGASSIDRHGEYVFKDYTNGLPTIFEDNFIDKLNELIEAKKIDVIFPTHDTVAEFLSQKAEQIDAIILSSDKFTSEICRNKKKTFDLFKDCDFCPGIYEDFSCFPVFVKPCVGQGGVGAFKVESKKDVPLNFVGEDMVICEYLSGEEYTVDCITDKNGGLCGVFPRSRKRTLAGITVCGSSEPLTEEIEQIAMTINSRLKFTGLWYFQLKRNDNGKFKLMEISARCPGSMCITRARGINLPLLSVYAAMGKNTEVFTNSYNVTADRALIARYKIDYAYTRVYMDFDDTLIINNEVCLNMIRFVYQCKNKKIPVILLSHHNADHDDVIEECMKKHAISQELFNEIVSLPLSKEKSDFIEPNGSIFIDNAYSERKKVHDKYGIPVFDVDCVEVLFDWRN